MNKSKYFILICLLYFHINAFGDIKSTKDSVSEIIELLLSNDSNKVLEAERYLEENYLVIIDKLLNQIYYSDLKTKGNASYKLNLLISSWSRGKERSERFYQYTSFKKPQRPVERLPNCQLSNEIRDCLRLSISSLLNSYSKFDKERYLKLDVLESFCESLGEIITDDDIDWVLSELNLTHDYSVGKYLIGLIYSHFGRPTSFDIMGICGNSTKSEIDAFLASKKNEFEKTKVLLKTEWSEFKGLSIESRIKKSIKYWDSYYKERSLIKYEWLWYDLEPLIRFGTPAIEILKQKQASEKKIKHKGLWEIVISSITGEENDELLKMLFDGDEEEIDVALNIIVASNSKNWLKRLKELQFRKDINVKKVSQVISTLHGYEGLPILEKAFKENPDNYSAKYGILELKERKEKGFPTGLRRHRF